MRLPPSGVRFDHAFVTTAICSPSRAACLSGMYGTRNGVSTLGAPLRFPKATFAHALRDQGYRTIQLGKWHLKTTPSEAGFQDYARIDSNGSWFQRKVDTNLPNVPKNLDGKFFETFMADAAIAWLSDHVSSHPDEPFVMWWCNQVPHVDGEYQYPDVKTDPTNKTHHQPEGTKGGFRATYDVSSIKVPQNWSDDLSSKPPYLATSRFVMRPIEENYGGPGGYSNPAPGVRNSTLGEDNVQQSQFEYNAAITALDAEIGRVLARIEDPNGDGDKSDSIADNTWIIFMGDNGWQTGHRKMTSKVLAYEESMRVPLIIKAPGIAPRVDSRPVLNIDLTPTIFDLAGVEIPDYHQGKNLRPLVEDPATEWRDSIYYEAVIPQKSLGAKPHEALRTTTHKLILTYRLPRGGQVRKTSRFHRTL